MTMQKMLEVLNHRCRDGNDLVMATVVASSGSTPRGIGARMLVSKDGRLYGTVGGGAVEFEAIRVAGEVLREKSSKTRSYRLSSNEIMDLGMVCGGNVTIYFQYIAGGDADILSLCNQAARLFDSMQDAWLVIDLCENNGKIQIGVPGSSVFGLSPDEAAALYLSRAIQCEFPGGVFYSEPLVRSGRVYIFGGGHVAQALVPALARVQFSCVVMDDRPEYASMHLFPGARGAIVGSFEDISRHLSINHSDYLIVMTRGHSCDYQVTLQLLRTNAAYIGVIGSRKKALFINQKLLEEGFSQADIDRIHSPIGLDILAETPDEIAVSIVAELIMTRARIHSKS